MSFHSTKSVWAQVLPRAAFLAPLFEGKRILEVDSRSGALAEFLSEQNGAQVTGLEQEGPLLREARDRAREGLAFEAWNGRDFPFEAQSFDIVIAFELRPARDQNLLSEIARVLESGGFLVCAISGEDDLEKSRAALGERFSAVSVFAQAPFAGSTFTPLSASADLPLEMDTGLLGEESEAPTAYLVVCGSAPIEADFQSLVQIPAAEANSTEELRQRETLLADRERSLQNREETIEDLQEELTQRGQALERDRMALDQERASAVNTGALREGEARLSEERARIERERAALEAREADLAGRIQEAEALRGALAERDRALLKMEVAFRERDEVELRLPREALTQALGSPPGGPEEVLGQVAALAAAQKSFEAERRELEEARARLERKMAEEAAELSKLRLDRDLSRDRTAEAGQEIARLQAEVAEKLSWLEASRAEVERLDAAQAELEAEGRSRTEALVGRETELHHAEKLRAGVEAALSTARAALKEREAAFEAIRQRLAEAEGIALSLRRERDVLADSERRLGDQAAALERTRSGLEAEVEALKGQLSERGSELRSLADQLRAREQESADAIRALEAKAGDLKVRLIDAEERVQRAEEQLQSVRAELAALRASRAAESDRSLGLERELGQALDRLRELESDLIEMVNRREEAEASRRAAEDSAAQAEQRKRHLTELLDDANEKNAALVGELYKVREQAEDQAGQLEGLRSELERQVSMREALAADVLNLRQGESSALQELRAERDALSSSAAELERRQAAHAAELETAERAQRAAEAQAAGAQAALKAEQDRAELTAREVARFAGELEAQTKVAGELRAQAELSEGERREADAARSRADALAAKLQAAEQACAEGHEALELAGVRERTQKTQLQALEAQFAELERATGIELTSLGAEVRRREEQMHGLTERLAEIESRRTWWENRAGELERELEQERLLKAKLLEERERQADAALRDANAAQAEEGRVLCTQEAGGKAPANEEGRHSQTAIQELESQPALEEFEVTLETPEEAE